MNFINFVLLVFFACVRSENLRKLRQQNRSLLKVLKELTAENEQAVGTREYQYKLSSNGPTTWIPAVQITLFSDERCKQKITGPVEVVGDSGTLNPSTVGADKAFNGGTWRPQRCSSQDRPTESVCGEKGKSSCKDNPHACASGKVWVTFKTKQEVKCVSASTLGQGEGGGNKWNKGLHLQEKVPNGLKTIAQTSARSVNKNRVNVRDDAASGINVDAGPEEDDLRLVNSDGRVISGNTKSGIAQVFKDGSWRYVQYRLFDKKIGEAFCKSMNPNYKCRSPPDCTEYVYNTASKKFLDYYWCNDGVTSIIGCSLSTLRLTTVENMLGVNCQN